MSFTPNRNIIRDKTGATVDVSRYGQITTASRHDYILCRFEYNNSTYDVTTTTSGTGAASNSNSQAVASTGAGVGTCVFSTAKLIAYRPAHEVYGYMSAVFSAGVADTTQRVGIFDTNDGFYFGFSGANFGIGIRNSAVDTFVNSSAWNKDKCDGTGTSGFVLDPTKYNQYKITYGWLGIAPITFWVYGGESLGWIICHVHDKTNSQTVPTIQSPCLRMQWEVRRTSGSGAVTLAIGCVAGGALSGAHSHAGHRVFSATSGPKTLTASTETMLLAIRSETTFQSLTNKICSDVMLIAGSTDGTKNVRINVYENASITAGAWSSIDSTNSVMSKNTTMTGFTGGTTSLVIPMLKTDTLLFDTGVGHIHLDICPGENLLITGYSTSANDVEFSLTWEEYFA